MQIEEELRKCVGFVTCKINSKYVERGTVFFVGHKVTDGEADLAFAVTARHVVKNAIAKSDDQKIQFRLNDRNGQAVYVQVPNDAWEYPDDQAIDLAATSFELDGQKYNQLCIPERFFIQSDTLSSLQVNAGCASSFQDFSQGMLERS